jgi:hypothetical protein
MNYKRVVTSVVTLLLVFVCGAFSGVALCAYYATRGQSEKASRLSTLLNVRRFLVEYASTKGRYPEHVEDAIQDAGFLAIVQPEQIEYDAAGRPYPLGLSPMFRDKTPRRYGLFEKGKFTFYGEGVWTFW